MASTFPVFPARLRLRSLDFAARALRTGNSVWQAGPRRKAASLRCVLGSQRGDQPFDDRLLEIRGRPYVPSLGLHNKIPDYRLTLDPSRSLDPLSVATEAVSDSSHKPAYAARVRCAVCAH